MAMSTFTMKKGSSAAVAALIFIFLALAASSLKPLVIVNLKGTGNDEAALAIQSHDFSIAGFANRSKHWHAFPGYESLLGVSTTPLPFGNSYRDLIGGVANLPLGKAPTLHDVSVLSAACDPAAADDEGVKALKRALATLKLTKCDAMRLPPIREMMAKGWENGDARVAPEHLPYFEHLEAMRTSARA
ncbi:hypothetical protein EJB05_46951, partial [Eragrostis curvula]